MATPRYRPLPRAIASSIAVLSVPWQLACTITPRASAQMVMQGNQRFERRVGGRVAAIVRIRELLGGAEYVAVGIARERGQRMRGFDRIRIWRKTGLHGLFGLH